MGGRLALGLPVRRLRVCPGLLGHDDGLRLGLGLPVHRLRLHGDRLHGDRLHGDRLHDDGLGGRLNDCSLDDCSLDDMAWLLSLSSTKFWREARRLLGLHRVGTLRPGERLVAPRPHSVPRIDFAAPQSRLGRRVVMRRVPEPANESARRADAPTSPSTVTSTNRRGGESPKHRRPYAAP